MKNLNLPAIFISILLFTGCHSFEHDQEQEFDYIPLTEYQYTPANIPVGTEVQLLAFSGGKENEKNNIYYYQFIVTRIDTNDTLRILAPFISVDESAGVDNKTYVSPLQFDPSKSVTNAFYELEDSSTNLLLQTDRLEKGFVDTTKEIQELMHNIKGNRLVVINKSMPIFLVASYQTAVGILRFKQIPW